jgi:hypothetical protein
MSSGDGNGESFQDMEAMGAEKPLSEQAAPATIDASTSASITVSKQPDIAPAAAIGDAAHGNCSAVAPSCTGIHGTSPKPAALSSAEDEGQVDDRKMARKHKVSPS